MRYLAFLGSVLVAVACSDSTGPDFPDATGRFNGEWIMKVKSANVQVGPVICSGWVSVDSQSGGTISGEILFGEGSIDCGTTPDHVTGTVATDGRVELHMPRFEAGFHSMDCTELAWVGFLTGQLLTLTQAITCIDGDVTVTLESSFRGTR